LTAAALHSLLIEEKQRKVSLKRNKPKKNDSSSRVVNLQVQKFAGSQQEDDGRPEKQNLLQVGRCQGEIRLK
jgi:hypothetical protein